MQNSSRPRLAALTSTRFFAALGIVLFHMWAMKGLTKAPAWLQHFVSTGYVSVSFFFVLSGFVLVYTYSARPLDQRAFWRARMARLYPAYLFSLVLCAPFFFIGIQQVEAPEFAWFADHLWETAALVLAMAQAWVPQAALGWNGVAWAVSVEIFFYIVFPLLLPRFMRTSSRRLALVSAGSWLAALAAAAAYVVWSPDGVVATAAHFDRTWLNALKFNPIVRLPEFLMGMACGCWFLRRELKPGLASALILGGMATVLAVAMFSHHIPYPVLHTGLLAPAFAAIICGVAQAPRWISMLEWKWLVILGESSYCLFLLHALVVGMFLFPDPEQLASPARLALAAVTAIALGLLAWRFVEQPARERFRGNPAPRHAAMTG